MKLQILIIVLSLILQTQTVAAGGKMTKHEKGLFITWVGTVVAADRCGLKNKFPHAANLGGPIAENNLKNWLVGKGWSQANAHRDFTTVKGWMIDDYRTWPAGKFCRMSEVYLSGMNAQTIRFLSTP